MVSAAVGVIRKEALLLWFRGRSFLSFATWLARVAAIGLVAFCIAHFIPKIWSRVSIRLVARSMQLKGYNMKNVFQIPFCISTEDKSFLEECACRC